MVLRKGAELLFVADNILYRLVNQGGSRPSERTVRQQYLGRSRALLPSDVQLSKLLPMGGMKLATGAWILAHSVFLLASSSAAAADKFFDSDGVRIRFVDVGQGEPIVLVHGFTGNLEGWNRGDILNSLARDYRVVALDCRGHGKSDKPHDPESYGSHMAEDVLRLMDHLNITKAHVVGYSMGARLTAYLLANHSTRFITATLGGSPPRRAWGPWWENRVRDYSTAMSERGRTATDAARQDYAALAAIPKAWHTQVVSDEQLRAVPLPVLAIVGGKDSADRIDGLKELKGLLLSFKLVVIDGATHGGEEGALNRPEFLRSLQEFIGSHAVSN